MNSSSLRGTDGGCYPAGAAMLGGAPSMHGHGDAASKGSKAWWAGPERDADRQKEIAHLGWTDVPCPCSTLPRSHSSPNSCTFLILPTRFRRRVGPDFRLRALETDMPWEEGKSQHTCRTNVPPTTESDRRWTKRTQAPALESGYSRQPAESRQYFLACLARGVFLDGVDPPGLLRTNNTWPASIPTTTASPRVWVHSQ